MTLMNDLMRPEVGKTYEYVKVGQEFISPSGKKKIKVWSEFDHIPRGYEHWDTVYETIYRFATVVKEDGDRYLFHVTDEPNADKQFVWYELGQDFFMSEEGDLEWYHNALYLINE